MNARAEITMDSELQRRAEAKAAQLGMSFSEYVRRLVANDVGGPEQKAEVSAIFDLVDEDYPEERLPVSALFDLGASDEPTDIARDKDRMVAEAVWEDYLRKTGRQPRPTT